MTLLVHALAQCTTRITIGLMRSTSAFARAVGEAEGRIDPGLTPWRFGRWSTDLMSPQVPAPLLNGFLAATISYLLVDRIMQARVAPRVFPAGRLADVPGARPLGVHGRLLVFLAAVAFLPLFALLGLVRAAVVRTRSACRPGSRS